MMRSYMQSRIQRVASASIEDSTYTLGRASSSFFSQKCAGVVLTLLFTLCGAGIPVAQAQLNRNPTQRWEQLEQEQWALIIYSSVDQRGAETAAQRFRSRYQEQPIDILVTTKSRSAPYRVAIGPYASLAEARAARAQLKGLPEDAWLWEIPPHAVLLYRTFQSRAAVPLQVTIDEEQIGAGLIQKERGQDRLAEDRGAVETEGQAAVAKPPASGQQAAGQQAAGSTAARGRRPKRIEARRLSTPIQVDGVLSEATWQVPGNMDFKQHSPKIGAPASEKTAVWVAYDDKALYVAARCYDRDPARISRTIGRRDSDVDEADWFSVSIDTYRDRRTGFFFVVTSGGSIRDGTIYDEVRTDDSWDGVWEHNTAIDTLGWSVEMRIPFAQLRFDAEQEVWGVNFARHLPRTNEVVDFVAPWWGRKVRFFAELAGLQGIRSPVQLEVLPYVVTQAQTYEEDKNNPFFPGRELGSRIGGDVKLRLGPSINVDGTINPDFGQVEVDPAVINLTDQETFLEEKRPFFLEDAHLFTFGRGRGLQFFHSRRIGQAPRGTPIHQGSTRIPEDTRILGSVKLSGKVNESWNIGWINVVTAREYAQVDSSGVRFRDEVAPLSYYDVVRVRREKDEGRQAIGFFGSGVLRDLRENHLKPVLNDKALVGGMDGWHFLGKRRRWLLEGWASVSHAAGDSLKMLHLQQTAQRYFQRPDASHLRLDSSVTSLNGGAGELKFGKIGGKLQMRTGLKFVTPGFELNDLGFLRHADRITGDVTFLYGQWRPRGVLNRGFVGITFSQAYDFGWTRLNKTYTVFARGWFANFWEGRLSVSYAPEGLDVTSTRGGPAMLAPVGWSGSASLSTNSNKPLLLSISGEGSRDEGGSWSYGLGGDLTWRPSTKLMVSLTPWWSRSSWEAGFLFKRRDQNAVDTYGLRNVLATLSQDYFSTDLRLNWTFTPKLSLQTYFQLYFAKVRYDRFKELALPASYAFNIYGEGASTLSDRDETGGYTVDPDGEGPAGPFTFYDSNFDFASLRGTTVLRWEYRKGSTLYLAWTHDRFSYEDFWTQPDGGLLAAAPFNKFVFKLTFWLNP